MSSLIQVLTTLQDSHCVCLGKLPNFAYMCTPETQPMTGCAGAVLPSGQYLFILKPKHNVYLLTGGFRALEARRLRRTVVKRLISCAPAKEWIANNVSQSH